jgi:hypothetical protein
MWEFGEEEGVSAIYCLLGGKISASAWVRTCPRV